MSDEFDTNDPAYLQAREIVRAAFHEAFEPPRLIRPGSGHVGVREVLAASLGLEGARLDDLGALPRGDAGHRLVARRYLVANGEVWLRRFVWQPPLRHALAAHFAARGTPEEEARSAIAEGLAAIEKLVATVRTMREELSRAPEPDENWIDELIDRGEALALVDEPRALRDLVVLDALPELRRRARERLRERATELYSARPEALDLLYLATMELSSYPAHCVDAGRLRYVIVADKGEMGVRAVREAIALGKVPVTIHSIQDDPDALQVRLTRAHRGITIGLDGNFRESYANYEQIAARLVAAFRARFGRGWREELSRAALYPGYGPLAENAAAIAHFRRNGIVFVGPTQCAVESVGDKRRFRLLAESFDPEAVTPGVVIDADEPAAVIDAIRQGHARGTFGFPGRLKAANGGGGRGQAVVASMDELEHAVAKVLGEIRTYNWDPGVMFEQNIPETIHLEVQVLRDRYGNTRHFGMRDCSEQRASQKIQEEAPPALLRVAPELRRRIEETAVRIADAVGYVGAGTVELMYKDGRVYFLEMNTRIQVEHPVTEESHRIVRDDGSVEPLNLVRWQLMIAEGKPIDFEQRHVVATHVAREFRLNAESWNPSLKDGRDKQYGLFVPNAGRFDRIEVPTRESVLAALPCANEIDDLTLRFDCGFEPGDTLVNKDPTFAKLVVALRARDSERAYELLRLASLEVLRQTRITGRQVRPDGSVIEGTEFKTNLDAHRRILEEDVMRRHSRGDERGRHVNWVVQAFRAKPSRSCS